MAEQTPRREPTERSDVVVAGTTERYSEAVSRLRGRILRQVSSVEAEHLTTFADSLLRHRAHAYTESLGDDALFAVLSSAWAFFTGAGPVPRVRVFNPERGRDGWDGEATIVEMVVDASPATADTILGHLHRKRFGVLSLLTPTLCGRRERDGGLIALEPTPDRGDRECFVHAVLDSKTDPALLGQLEADLASVAADLHVVSRDQRRLRERCEALAQDLEWLSGLPTLKGRADEVREVAAWLRWLMDGNFEFLGHREDRIEGPAEAHERVRVDGADLGIGGSRWSKVPGEAAPASSIFGFAESGFQSPVHPFGSLAELTVNRLAPDGHVLAEARFLGTLTPKAFGQKPAEIPLLRRRLDSILEAEAAEEGSQERRDLVTVFNGFPIAHVLAVAPGELVEDIRATSSAGPDDVSVTCRPIRTVSGRVRLAVSVSMPRSWLTLETQQRIEDLLVTRAGAVRITSHLPAETGERGWFHVAIDVPPTSAAVDVQMLRSQIEGIVHAWGDLLLQHLEKRYPVEESRRIASRFRGAFAVDRVGTQDIRETVDHIGCALEVERTGGPVVAVGPPGATPESRSTVLRLYFLGAAPSLDVLAGVLGDFGIRVRSESRWSISLPEGSRIDGVSLALAEGGDDLLRRDDRRRRFADAFRAVHRGDVESDRLDTLVLTADLDWMAVDCLRMLVGYARQAGAAASGNELVDALTDQPEAARALYEFFNARFLPKGTGDPVAIRAPFAARLRAVREPNARQIFERLGSVVEATVRTNAVGSKRSEGAPPPGSLAIKVRTRDLGFGGVPVPRDEIYVHARDGVGLYARAGRVARGRIARCDSIAEIRPEVLRRLETETALHAGAVPVGAAGAFASKKRAAASSADEKCRTAGFESFLRGLLDLTDDYAAAEPKRDSLVYDDEPDGYLAFSFEDPELSRLARSLASEYGFWLADGFTAGSTGFPGTDPSRSGIAARSAWECVRAHLLEAGRVVDDPIMVIGSGDMKDDFFRKGVLFSPGIRLRAAVGSTHILLDPNPRPDVAMAEQERLAREGLGWDAYDPSKLGRGGMVLARDEEGVRLTPEARAFLGVESEEVDGDGLVRAVLRAPADVLWGGSALGDGGAVATSGPAGGAQQTLLQGSDLRAAVIAEGSQGALSQRARVEYALGGGRINTLAIDAAGEVDLADHEINLKVLFQPMIEAGNLTPSDRDAAIAQGASEVVGRVLGRVRAQHQALSYDRARSETHLGEYLNAVGWLKSSPPMAALQCDLAELPDRDALDGRRPEDAGLTRPELSVLFCGAKHALKEILAGGSFPIDDELCTHFLERPFPSVVRERFADAIRGHRLRRELTAAELANDIVNTCGSAWLASAAREHDATASETARGWLIAHHVIGGAAVTDALWSGTPRSWDSTLQIHRQLASVLEGLTGWVLRNVRREQRPCEVVRELSPALESARAHLTSCFSASEAERFHHKVAALELTGLGSDLTRALVLAEWFPDAFDVARIGTDTGTGWCEAAKLWYGLGDWLDFPWLGACIAEAQKGDDWQRLAARGLAENLRRARGNLVARLCRAGATAAGPDARGIPQDRARKIIDLVASAKRSPRVSSHAPYAIVQELTRLSETN